MQSLAFLYGILLLLNCILSAADDFDPFASVYREPPLLTVPHAARAPLVDGAIGSGEWDCASATTGFYLYTSGLILDVGPRLFLAWDDRNLYALVATPCDPTRDLVARELQRDGQVYADDSVELYLRPPGGPVFQFVVNSLGTVADYRDRSSTWDCEAWFAAGRATAAELPGEWGVEPGGYWFVEAAIPLAELVGVAPRAGDEWTANFAVNRGGPWAVCGRTIGSTYDDTAGFCALRFLGEGEPYAQVLALGRASRGEVALRGSVVNPGAAVLQASVELDLRKEGSTLAQDAYRHVIGVIQSGEQALEVPAGGKAEFLVRQEVRDSSVDRMAWRVFSRSGAGEAPTVLALRSGPVQIHPPLRVTVGNVPSRRYAVVTVDAAGLAERPLEVELDLVDAAGMVLLAKRLTLTEESAETRLDYADVPVGRYRLRARTRLASGTEETGEAWLNVLAPPEWLTSSLYDDYGKQDRVLLPWTPVQIGEREVRVWGRVMRWTADSLLPASISSQSEELLAGPMQLLVSLGGRERAVPLGSFQVTERKASRVSFRATGSVDGVDFIADMWVEYDGFLWVTLQARDGVPDRMVDGLRIVVPVRPGAATLYQTFCRRLTGFIGSEPIPLPWMADPAAGVVNFYHWLGNEDLGLGFTYTSLEHWAPQSEEAFCTIIPSSGCVWYQVSLVEKPVRLDGRTFQFGIQATPIKPLPPDYHSMVTAAAHFTEWKACMRTADNMDDVVIWPPGVMRGLNDPEHVNAEGVASQVRAAHEKGIAVLFAGCPQKISPLNEGFEDWRLEWEVLPESILNWEGIPHWQNCGRSYTLCKWLFYHWTQLVQRFGLDGIYWDGWMTGQIACSNPHHGCGWTDESGRRHLTVPVLEGRDFNQRMAAFLEDHVNSPYRPRTAPERPGFPRYIWRIHSWEFVPSVMGYGTHWLTGEFAAFPLDGPSMLTPEGTLGKSVGLGLLRTRCLSTNWGVPNLFHVMMWEHTENHPTDRQTRGVLAWLLPHGIPVGELAYLNQNTFVQIARAMTSFETRRARFTPAWRANPYLVIETPTCPEVMVATWDHHPQPRVLAVVSNLKVEEAHEVTLRWMGFAEPKVTDALTGEQVPVVDGRLHVQLGPETFVLLRIEQ